jgi:aldose 1-epimerase
MHDTLIPTGTIAPVAGTPFDFRKPTPIGLRIRDGNDTQIRYCHGYDMNFVVDGPPGTLRLAARVEDPLSGRVLEPQDFPDAPNHPNFPSATLDPGATYHNVTVYRFAVRR